MWKQLSIDLRVDQPILYPPLKNCKTEELKGVQGLPYSLNHKSTQLSSSFSGISAGLSYWQITELDDLHVEGCSEESSDSPRLMCNIACEVYNQRGSCDAKMEDNTQ